MVAHDSDEVQQFLDTNQYSTNGVLRYEKIFGRTFVSTGGRQTTAHFLDQMPLKKDMYILDVGCGIGGSAFMMDQIYGCKVRGIDLSTNMISLAQERQKEVGSTRTSFHIEDITTAEYRDGEFDLIYSRDAIMHLENKLEIYSNFYRWLKPGSTIFITEYSCRRTNQTQEFIDYVKTRDYKLISPEEYEAVVKEAGFDDVQVHDLKEYFLEILRAEKERTESIREEYVKEFSQKDYDDIVNGWTDKIRRVSEGSHKWISVSARKPQTS